MPVEAAIAEFDRVGRAYFLEKYGFGKSREYMLRDPTSGKLYDSKAIVGAAYGYAFPDEGALKATDFSGGEATVERLLTDLGFQVVRVGQDWTADEVEATVRDYFGMLRKEAAGQPQPLQYLAERLGQLPRARDRRTVARGDQLACEGIGPAVTFTARGVPRGRSSERVDAAMPSMLELIDRVHLGAIESYRPMGLPVEIEAVTFSPLICKM